MPELLRQLQRDTGLVFMAVCSGGAALCKPDDAAAASFAELLSHLPPDLDILIAVVCGNDFWAKQWPSDARKLECWQAAAELCNGMRERARKCFAVAGGSASTLVLGGLWTSRALTMRMRCFWQTCLQSAVCQLAPALVSSLDLILQIPLAMCVLRVSL